MRPAVASDTHGNLAAPEAVLADVRTRGREAVMSLDGIVDDAQGASQAEPIAVDHDHEAAAPAQARGRPGGAHALRTGRAAPED
ncbi:hypothetical protein [Vulcaniibacterium tengchongense]|uniref:Calcineurin-like phosphoesterase family protein n=1 Tax=Vulcaniibacterium tengchongense TaxID=1273429 RepID=A0A3N4VVG6_9GAMM|nr:hypothetical protein [Vulcaniibacterium tengchongense]RPE77064.1 hypothetical protein EDC50_2320 [Vulcaniibacterium tengchongense]